jgi:hypothetical protein
MKIERTIYITYSQLTIFSAYLENPFNDWTKEHVMQGFAWRSNSVSFKTLDVDGDLRITVLVNENFGRINNNTIRAIRVPFSIESELIEIASITDSIGVELSPGDYSLYFETGKDRIGMWCILTFVKKYDPFPSILICDDQLHPNENFLMTANPAL